MTFLSLLKPYRTLLLLIFLCLVTANILGLALPWGIKVLLDDVLLRRDSDQLDLIIGFLTLVMLIKAVLNYVRQCQSGLMGERIICGIRQKIYNKGLRLAMRRFRNVGPSQFMSRMTGDLDSLRRFLFGEAVEFLYSLFSVVLLLVVLLVIHPQLAMLSIAGIPFFLRIYSKIFPQLRENYRVVRETWGNVMARVGEVLRAMCTVRVLNGQRGEQDKLRSSHEHLIQVSSKSHALNARLWMWIDIFSSGCTVAVLWLGGKEVIQGHMTPGELVAFYSYLGMLLAPLSRMIVIQGTYQEASASLERINDVLDMPDGEKENALPENRNAMRGHVRFENVSFSYDPSHKTLHNISFDVQPGETVGIVGVSGSGKTTLVNLLMRFYEPHEGNIYVDDRNVADIDLTAYRHEVAVVLQDDVMLSGTIRENLCYGLGEVKEDDMREAAHRACAHSFIMGLPQGYDTLLGEKGEGLSTGQRQRLAIARALLRNPAVLILDEATSAVDALTENHIQTAVDECRQGLTTIIVAHRFSTLAGADRIIVIDKGEIAEMGDHNNLLNNRGIYSNLYLEQFHAADLTQVRRPNINETFYSN